MHVGSPGPLFPSLPVHTQLPLGSSEQRVSESSSVEEPRISDSTEMCNVQKANTGVVRIMRRGSYFL